MSQVTAASITRADRGKGKEKERLPSTRKANQPREKARLSHQTVHAVLLGNRCSYWEEVASPGDAKKGKPCKGDRRC